MENGKTRDNDWYKYCRICLEWLHPKRDLKPEIWVPEVVERAQGLNIDTLAFDFYHGGYAIFNNAVAPKDRHIGDADVLELLDRELHKRQMRLVAMNMGAHCARYASDEYPEWRLKDVEGNDMSWSPDLYFQMCVNTPYANLLLQEISEFLPRYQIDGLYIEGLYGYECYCDYCRTEFLKTYGYEIPRDESRFTDKNLRQFRADVITDFVRRVRKVIDEKSPETVFMPCPSFFMYADFNAWKDYADALTLERQWGYLRETQKSLYEIGLSMRIVRALSGRQPFGTCWLGWSVDLDYSHCTPQHYRLNFGEILINGGTPQLHAQTIFDLDQSEMETVREMYDLVEKVRPTLKNSHFIQYAALVLDWSDLYPSDNFSGFAKALIEKHVPFDVISIKDLSAGLIDKYKVLLLPNLEKMSEDEMDAIIGFHDRGGGVVMTYRSGCLRPDGTRRLNNRLFSIAGIKGPYGIVSNPVEINETRKINPLHTYYRIVKEHKIGERALDRLQSVPGNYTEVELTTGEAIADALDYDYSKMHKHHPVHGYYPGRPIDPMIVVNEREGKGRAVYFAAEFVKAVYAVGLPGCIDAIAEASVWAAAAPPPVEFDVSPTVEATAFYSPECNSYTLMLLNQTTNELHPGVVVRHVEPVHDIGVRVTELKGKVKNVVSIAGNKLEWKYDNGVCLIKIDRINEYEALIVEL